MANMTFKTNLLPNSTTLEYSLGSENQPWNIHGELNGNAATATKLKTARTLTIGETGKDFDGSTDVSWSHAEIGATVSNTWTAGTTAGPTITTTVNGVDGTAVAIPSASASESGVVTTGTQTFTGAKTFLNDDSAAVGINISRTSITKGTVPTATQYNTFCFTDSTGDTAHSTGGRMAIVESYTQADGRNSLQMSVYPNTINSTATNYLRLHVKQDGTKSYDIADPAAFRTALGTDSVYVKKAGDTMTGQLYINLDQDVGLNQNGSIVIGNKAGLNIGIDANEIMARNNGAASTLNLNVEGGNICTSTMYPYAAQKTLGLTGATQHYYRLYLGGPTTDSKALNSGNPFIEFANTDRSQYGQIVYTDFNNQGGSDSFSFRSNQTDLRVYAPKLHGAVWNDYAEFRQSKITEPGRCIKETGNGELVLTTKRLEKGCEIISDTYGFAIGESDICKTPTACTGRVLAFPYEDKEIFKQHIGDPVCSGPNGTVSIMTEEEERNYPSRIIGTISEIPTYETWYAGDNGKLEIKINGRIWIRIR